MRIKLAILLSLLSFTSASFAQEDKGEIVCLDKKQIKCAVIGASSLALLFAHNERRISQIEDDSELSSAYRHALSRYNHNSRSLDIDTLEALTPGRVAALSSHVKLGDEVTINYQAGVTESRAYAIKALEDSLKSSLKEINENEVLLKKGNKNSYYVDQYRMNIKNHKEWFLHAKKELNSIRAGVKAPPTLRLTKVITDAGEADVRLLLNEISEDGGKVQKISLVPQRYAKNLAHIVSELHLRLPGSRASTNARLYRRAGKGSLITMGIAGAVILEEATVGAISNAIEKKSASKIEMRNFEANN
ncbi:MAG: hypothetical protein V4596_02485 [Bdellovibrionota bacterium]